MDITKNQKTAVIIFTVILGCTIIILSMLTNYWFLHSLIPVPLPNLATGDGRTADMVKQDIDNYKNLIAVIKENQSYLNELLVVKFIKGLFDSLIVAIIAYVFGKPMILAIAARMKGNRQH